RAELLEVLLVRGRSDPKLVPDPRAFPSFDVVAQGFTMLGEWAEAGHPTAAGARDNNDPKALYFDRLVCASAATERGFRTLRASNCRPTFYAAAVRAPQAQSRLLQLAAGSRDPVLFREVALNLVELTSSRWGGRGREGIDAVLALWRAVEQDPQKFGA